MTVRRGILHKMRSVVRDRRGQSTIEYFLMLFIAVMVALKFKGIIVGKITALSGKLDTKLEQASEDIN